eukprot:7171931-Ditylum_brightwellii.AAC.1
MKKGALVWDTKRTVDSKVGQKPDTLPLPWNAYINTNAKSATLSGWENILHRGGTDASYALLAGMTLRTITAHPDVMGTTLGFKDSF